MLLNRVNIIKIFFLIVFIFSFFVGFALKDYVPGGAITDFRDMIWPTLQSFKKDFYFSIENYGSFTDASYPLYYIINAYLNPFTSNKTEFLFSITIISFASFFLFAFLLKKNLSKIEYLDCLLVSSIILLLPFYRSSAYWGTSENFGWIFFILALYNFLKIRNYSNKPNNYEIFITICFCFFSSCALYIRPALVFFHIIYFIYMFLNNRNIYIILISAFSYLVFAIPGFILIFIWGGFYDYKNFNADLMEDYHNYKFIIRNIPILLSYFAFYFFPVLIIEYLHIGIKKFSLKYFKPFFSAILLLLFLWQFNYLNYLGEFILGGGAILKLNYLIKAENFLLLLLASAIGFSIIYQILKENFKVNVSILLPVLIIYGFPNEIYQEYVEPLILFIFLSGMLQTKYHEIYFRNINLSNLITISYVVLYLLGATYYKHF